VTLYIGNLKFGEMEFGEMKRNTSKWSNFCMLPRRAGLSASAGLSCFSCQKSEFNSQPVTTSCMQFAIAGVCNETEN